MRPNYLVIGAQKCATSSLCGLLGRHPDVFMTDPKEPYFFSHPEVFARGLTWYESLFAGGQDCTAIGEGSTTYTQHGLYPEAPGRIARALPDAKLIYIVRDPLDRIVSHWMHLRSRENLEPLPFNDAVRKRPEYLDNSRYLEQIERFRADFPDERILILFFDDLKANPRGLLARCFAFLGVDEGFEIEDAPAAQHVSSAGRVDTRILTPLRRLPFFRRLRDGAPGPVRERLRQLLKSPIGRRPEWSDEARQWAIERLAADSRAFLNRYDGGSGRWSWVT